MTIIITGANGFIGSSIMKQFQHKGLNIIGLIRDNKNIQNAKVDRKFIKISYNINDLTKLFIDQKPSIIIHAAGAAAVSKSITNPSQDYEDSVMLWRNILEATRISGIKTKLIFLSSAAVYGNAKKLPLTELDQLEPISPYGYHKLICEKLCEEYIRCFEQSITVLRIFSVFGPNQKRLIIWDIVQKYLYEDIIQLDGVGDEERDFIFIDDLARIFEDIISSAHPLCGIYNIASGRSINVRDVALSIGSAMNYTKPLMFSGTRRVGDPVKWRADITKLKSAIGELRMNSFYHNITETVRVWRS